MLESNSTMQLALLKAIMVFSLCFSCLITVTGIISVSLLLGTLIHDKMPPCFAFQEKQTFYMTVAQIDKTFLSLST